MTILIDGDSCHVIQKTEAIAKKYGIPCHIYCDTTRIIKSNYSTVHIVEKGRNSADFAIINKCSPHDIVITNDTGLATMALSKKAYAVKPCGVEYTSRNIDGFLVNRYVASETRRKTNRKQVRGKLYENNPICPNYNKTLTRLIQINSRREYQS